MEAHYADYNYAINEQHDLEYINVRNTGPGFGLYTSSEEACQRAADASNAMSGVITINRILCNSVDFRDTPSSGTDCSAAQLQGSCDISCDKGGCFGVYLPASASGAYF